MSEMGCEIKSSKKPCSSDIKKIVLTVMTGTVAGWRQSLETYQTHQENISVQ